ncbi:hypothetical protein LJR168_003599 [Pseudoxanthomonas sp. LjRoot168]|uniref:hypothetical protein n=1 Tax=unclassified Pseudoxanthomonas TaxID=2645906 RepID=UPI003ECCBF70
MKLIAIGAIAFSASLAPISVLAGEISLKSDVETCESEIPEDKAAVVQASRVGDMVTLDVTAELNCAHVPDKPELRVWRSAATVSLSTKSPSEAAATCLCTHKLSFEIRDLYEGVQTIYYVQDGTSLGHADAP